MTCTWSPFLKVGYEESIEFLVKQFRFASHADLFYAIASGELTIPEIMKQVRVEKGKLVEVQEDSPIQQSDEEIQPRKSRKKEVSRPKMLINGEPAEAFDYQLASCCNPVPGDEIFAYLTSSAGLKIHRTTCPNADHLMANYGYRVMKAEWVSAADSVFVANLLIVGIDSGPGVIEKVSHQISSSLGLNMRSFSMEAKEGTFEGRVSLLVQNTDQLYMAIRSLQNLDNITSVVRID
jgi:GTP pyrophosphokinase